MIVQDSLMQSINLQTRGIDKSTDVLSLGVEQTPHERLLGTCVISIDAALGMAQTLGHSVDDEVALLFIHSLLHLQGYDHETDDGAMRDKEQELVKQFDLPKSLIIRTQE